MSQGPPAATAPPAEGPEGAGGSPAAPGAMQTGAAPGTQRPGPDRLFALLLALAALLPFAVHRQFLSDDAFLYQWDSGQSHLSRFRTIGEAIRDGRLALWQTIAYAGSPFHANPENPTLYPPVLLLTALLPPLLALNLTALLHLSLAIVGMGLLVRQLWRATGGPAQIAGPLVAAVLFGLNSYTRIEHWNLVTYGAAHALIPWIFLAAHALLTGEAPRRAAGALGLLLGLAVLTGGLYVYTYAFFGLLLWFVGLGLLGGPAARRRALTFGLLAALVGGLIMLAKLLPYAGWVATTNREDALDPEFAKGVTLAGHHVFVWARLSHQILKNTAQGLVLVLALCSLPLLRRGVVRMVLVLGVVGVLVAAGPLYELLYAWVPPFDQVRNAIRGWTLANAFLPVAAGLGVNWLLGRLARARLRTVDRVAAPILAALCLPVLLVTGRHDPILDEPASYRQALTLYPNWTEMARRAGDEWRAMSLNVLAAGTRNEQFIASALGVETPGGFLGFAYPRAIARHVYTNHGPLRREPRLRRAAILSVRYHVYTEPPGLHDNLPGQAFPGGIDGPRRGQIEAARPRAFLPTSAAAVFGDDDELSVLYALLDAAAFPIDRATALSFGPGELPEPAELADLHELVVVAGSATETPEFVAFLAEASARGLPVTRVTLPLDPPGRTTLAELAERLARRQSPQQPAAHFARRSPEEVSVAGRPAERSGFVTLSETWSLYGGWQVRSDRGRTLTLRRADGAVTAVHLGPGESGLSAVYAPADVRLGLVLGAVGVLAALALLLPARARRPASDGPAPT